MRGATPQLPYASSWRDAQLSTETTAVPFSLYRYRTATWDDLTQGA
jgi:hypothetical protein